MGVRPPSATAMVKRLAALGLVEHERYRGAELTPAGERVALEVIRHHRLLELYLSQAPRPQPRRGALRGGPARACAVRGARGALRLLARLPHARPARRPDSRREAADRPGSAAGRSPASSPETWRRSGASRTTTTRSSAISPTTRSAPGGEDEPMLTPRGALRRPADSCESARPSMRSRASSPRGSVLT